MAQLNLQVPYKVNSSVISVAELKTVYLFGISIRDGNGNELPDSTFQFYIDAATKEVEKKLAIKTLEQSITESRDYSVESMVNWAYISTTYPVKKACALQGFYGNPEDNQPQVLYPEEWITTKKTNNNDQERYWRQIHLVATGTGSVTTTDGANVFPFIYPFARLFNRIPNYWRVTYITGFKVVPDDLTNIIGKMASIGLLNIAGDLILSSAGLASTSLSIDGLSQSISTTASATSAGYNARLLQYTKEIEASWVNLRRYYKGITMISL